MSVLIKGIPMPERCGRFTCPIGDWCQLKVIEAEDYIPMTRPDRYIKRDENGFPPNCPLVEVKTPHGDLIDRDSIAFKAKTLTVPLEWEEVEINPHYAAWLIANEKTVIEAEE